MPIYTSPNETATNPWNIQGTAAYTPIKDLISIGVEKKKDGKGISARLYFKYVKKKFNLLEKLRIDNRLKKIEKLFYKAVEDGQEILADKFLNKLSEEMRESLMYGKKIKMFVYKKDVDKYKYKIRDGNISDTPFKEYTRLIPKDVLEKKKKVEELFDSFVIYHYFNENQDNVKEMSDEEKYQMKDPILFGTIKENNKLYFIADWEDEYCDLMFDELIDTLGKEEDEITISRKPNLTI